MGFSLTKIFNWLKPKVEAPAPPAPPPPPPVLELPNLYQQTETDIMIHIDAALKNGATLKGSKALHQVCEQGWLEAAKFLLDKGADVDAPLASKYIHRWTPFLAASAGANPDLMQELLNRGAKGDAKDDAGHNATYHFVMDKSFYTSIAGAEAEARDRRAFKILLALGLELEPVMDHFIYNQRRHLADMLPKVEQALKFEKAVTEKDYQTVLAMMAGGMHPDVAADFSGTAALAVAAGQNDLKLMAMLMASGADVNRHSKAEDALHAAARAGAQEAFAKLVGAGANTEKLYTYDRYPDTNIVEVAGYCKTNPGMVDFVKNALARKEELKADYEATKEEFLHPYANLEIKTAEEIAIHKPIKLKRRTPAA